MVALHARSHLVFGDIEGKLDVLTAKRLSFRAVVGVHYELQEKGPTMRRAVERQASLVLMQYRALHNPF